MLQRIVRAAAYTHHAWTGRARVLESSSLASSTSVSRETFHRRLLSKNSDCWKKNEILFFLYFLLAEFYLILFYKEYFNFIAKDPILSRR